MGAPKSNYCTTPNLLFNHVLERMGLEADIELATQLGVHHSMISRIRHGAAGISDKTLAALVALVPNATLAELHRLGGIGKGVR